MVITASILDSTPSPTRDESGSTPASSVPGSLLLHQHPRVPEIDPEIRQEGSSGVVAEQSTAITTGAAGGAEGAGGGGEPWARGGGANPRPPALRSGAARGLSLEGRGSPPPRSSCPSPRAATIRRPCRPCEEPSLGGCGERWRAGDGGESDSSSDACP